jgi:hypothetical protein
MKCFFLFSSILLASFSEGAKLKNKQKYTYTFKGNGAYAYGSIYDGECIETFMDVQGNDSVSKSGGSTQASQNVYIYFSQYNYCTSESTNGGGEVPSASFISNIQTGASLIVDNAPVEIYTCVYQGGGGDDCQPPEESCTYNTIEVSLDVTWTPTGSISNQKSSYSGSYPGYSYRSRDNGKYRDATVAFTAEINGEAFAPDSVYGQLYKSSNSYMERYSSFYP